MLGPLTYGALSQVAAATPWYLSGGAPTPIVAYQPKGAASLAASYVNLVNPGTLDAAPGTAPTWDATNGWIFNGTTQYLTTGDAPSAAGSVIIVKFTGAVGTTICILGRGTGNSSIAILPNNGGVVDYRYGAFGAGGTKTPNLTTGTLAVSPTNGYRNGTAEGITVGAWSGSSAQPIFIGARNNGSGVAQLFFAGNVQAYVRYSTNTGEGTWVPAVSAAMAAL